MTFKTYEINVDLVNDASTTNTIRFSQNDRNSAKLLLTITNKGAELDLSQAKSVRMSFKKSDGTRVFQNDCQTINAMKGKYQILLKTQTLAAAGNVIAQIHIEEEDRTIDTQKFLFVVNDSLASDDAIESTNEFTIIQKAIEAGTKLEGKDINGIIAAGAKADAALPKAGGTMTGSLNTDSEIRFNMGSNQNILFKGDGTTTKTVWITKSQEGIVVIPETAPGSNSRDWASAVYLGGSQNGLVKKTGDTMTGALTMSNSSKITWKNADSTGEVDFAVAADGKMWITDKKANKTIATIGAGFLNVPGDTNLVKKTGDTMTGDIKLDRTGTSARDILWSKDGVAQTNLGMNSGNKLRLYDNVNALTAFEYDTTNKTFSLLAPNTNLVTKAKDGRVTLTLTADATNPDATRIPIAIRRGNTVTVRGSIALIAGAVGTTLTILPLDMRPTDSFSMTVTAVDGSYHAVSIFATGEIAFGPTAKGKQLNLVATYVVD
ncbi:BppU family phage baseplate upper protein [Bacillus mycoides]|uniref:BppU family phage baseplate upper protein n=1 Tax=Bacillus mycoides TaxID=1405 RepID=UPI0011EF36BD|nr:BppU family phage baseplate upper protein [Bacillus mycoides]QEL88488.1 DUF2479 domain-containing protein [Bacillus mycoides]